MNSASKPYAKPYLQGMETRTGKLKARIAELETELLNLKGRTLDHNNKDISTQFNESVNCSRLIPMQMLGNEEQLHDLATMTVAIVGLGGVGSFAAELLTGCKIAKLILFDYDIVRQEHISPITFQSIHLGQYKVEALKSKLQALNSEIVIEFCNANITTRYNYEYFASRLDSGSKSGGKVDLVLSCVDNLDARMAIDKACKKTGVNWFDSGVAENAMSGSIQFIIPGRVACCAWAYPWVRGTEMEEENNLILIGRRGFIAALLFQNALQYMLQLCKKPKYVSYSVEDFKGIKV